MIVLVSSHKEALAGLLLAIYHWGVAKTKIEVTVRVLRILKSLPLQIPTIENSQNYKNYHDRNTRFEE
jgi:hypothetical protein